MLGDFGGMFSGAHDFLDAGSTPLRFTADKNCDAFGFIFQEPNK